MQIKTTGYYPDLVIDIGVANGTQPLQNCFAQTFFFWIEPLIEFEEDLKRLKKEFTGDYEITAVGKKEGLAIININDDLHGSSLLEPQDISNVKIITREIQVSTINSLAKKHNLLRFEKIIIKLDVQGFELDVLEGAGEIMNNVDIIILEVGLFRHYKSAPDFYEVVVAMKKMGFVVYDIVEGLNRPYDFALSYKDLFFVKENGSFRKSHSWQ
jgi:FkbM family methyltransferase